MPTKLKTLDIETVKCANSLTSKNNKVEIKEHYTYSLVVGLNHSELVSLQVCVCALMLQECINPSLNRMFFVEVGPLIAVCLLWYLDY